VVVVQAIGRGGSGIMPLELLGGVVGLSHRLSLLLACSWVD